MSSRSFNDRLISNDSREALLAAAVMSLLVKGLAEQTLD